MPGKTPSWSASIRSSSCILAAGFVALPPVTPAQGVRMELRPACETGVLDPGENGMNVLVYELCPWRFTVGFESSETIEELTCGPGGTVRLWSVTGGERCAGLPPSDRDEVREFLEPLRGVGRTTSMPVKQLLTCPAGTAAKATIVVPDARIAMLETRRGDTLYERLVRRFMSDCASPMS